MPQTVLITGSSGLIGSEAVRFFCKKDFTVIGVDNDSRKYFFGASASTEWNRKLLEEEFPRNFIHKNVDIRNEKKVDDLFKLHKPILVIHTAAQPSHDWAAREPLTDFTINALGTHILLEAYRKFAPEGVFIFTSTNKVYGDHPNDLPLEEQFSRYEITESHPFYVGINETMSLDNCTHSIFGVSKTAADIMVQEYGRYWKLKTAVFRGGCLTGPAHSSAQLHGFLAYLVNSISQERPYKVIGYKGKQVRDNIHAYDVVNAFWHFFQKPRVAQIYNLGGGRYSNTSILEAVPIVEKLLNKKATIEYDPQNRVGDHIWYISDMSKFKTHYPDWNYTYDNEKILEELCKFAADKQK